MFTCQLSRITRELIFNFFDAREVVRTSSELFANAQDWLEILWKSQALFWSRRKLFYNLGYLQKSSGIFGNLWRSSGNLRQSSEVVENLWRFSKLEEYLRFLDFKTSWNYWKIWCAQMHFVIFITSDHIRWDKREHLIIILLPHDEWARDFYAWWFTTKFSRILIGLTSSRDAIVFVRGKYPDG